MSKSLAKGLAREFERQEDCDVWFSVEGKIIGAHKIVLKIRNSILYEKASDWNSNMEPIPIEDISYDSFWTLVRYIYTCKITLSEENVFLFLSASTLFKMSTLEHLCGNYINDKLGRDNVCMFMNEAVNFRSTALQEKCCLMFSEATDAFYGQSSFLHLSQPALSLFLDVEETNILEISLFYDVKRWMKRKCIEQKLPVTGRNMRMVIGDALHKIRFPTMNVQDFANSVSTIKGLLTDTEIAQIFQKITVFDSRDIDCPFSRQFRCYTNAHFECSSDAFEIMHHSKLYDVHSDQCYDMPSLFKHAGSLEKGEKICPNSLRIVLQCCIDLMNSSGRSLRAGKQNEDIRNELCDDFYSLLEVDDEGNIQEKMMNYMKFRTKFSKICAWA